MKLALAREVGGAAVPSPAWTLIWRSACISPKFYLFFFWTQPLQVRIAAANSEFKRWHFNCKAEPRNFEAGFR